MKMSLEMTVPQSTRIYSSYKCRNCGQQHSSSTTELLCQTDFNSISEPWSDADTKAYRVEVERRFRERTPAKSIIDADVSSRVTRGEMRAWSLKELGKELPELDREWGLAQVKWMRAMIRRVVKQLDPEMYQQVSKRLRQDAHMQKD